MHRTYLLAPLAGALALGAVGIFFLSDSPADTPVKQTAGQLQLPISQVILFSSGVGYFHREGEVEGNARIDLTFPVENINDLLKSMVLQDLGGGRVSAVSYDSRDPVEKTLKSFALNLTGNPTYGQLLNQARGEKVEVLMQQTNTTQPSTMTGVIMGIERQKQQVGKDGIVECEMLNLLCAEGIRNVKLTDVQKLRFLNPVIENELKRALDTLALSHDTQKKAVSLSFAGEGKRPVRVGYVTESPIWKTSYRLVLNKEGKPFLQGWAIVENTGDEDWKDVRMGLVSGRPISFQMNLYDPLYLARPVVEPELFASLRPVTYGGAMERGYGPGGGGGPMAPGAPPPGASRSGKGDGKDGGFGLGGGDKAEGMGRDRAAADKLKKSLNESMDLQAGVASAASAAEMGDYFQYLIEHPVSLPRQKSAMLPIVNQPVEGTKVSIYNERTQAKHPLLGLKFKNTSGMHLMQGPITVFEGSNYAGDSRILDLQPKEERLLSYAIDLGVEVEPVAKPTPDRLIKVKVNKGILYATNKVVETKLFNVKNRTEHERTLLIEHPFRPEFTLKTPEKYAERSRDVYRFDLKVPAGETAKQEVVEERDVVHSVQLTNSDDNQIRFFLSAPVTSDKVKEALNKALELKGKLNATQRDIAQLQRELKIITDDQVRLRQNIANVPPSSDAYKRYVKKFDTQESEIERLQDEIKKLQATEHQQRIAYENYLGSLNVE